MPLRASRAPLAHAPTVLGLLLAALAGACTAYQHQHAAPPAPRAAAPASEAFAALPLDQQLAVVRGEVQATKRRLREQGKYDCCVMPACNQCLLQHGECHCRHAVEKEGGPCCGECTEAWLEGRGMIEGIDAWELLERKKKQQDAGQPAAGSGKPPANEEQKNEHRHHRHSPSGRR